MRKSCKISPVKETSYTVVLHTHKGSKHNTVLLTSNLLVHTCPLASDSHATGVFMNSHVRVYVHASVHTRAMRVKHLCIAKINGNHTHSFSLALFSSFQLLHVLFILQLVNHASF